MNERIKELLEKATVVTYRGPTVDGDAAEGCNWAPIDCETCGSRPCDQGC
jgi:hypothetical protein